jgi:hypothetical protein
MNILNFLLLITLLSPKLIGQKDSIAYGSLGFQIQEGLYLNIEQLKSNKPIVNSQIISRNDNKQSDFLTELIKNEDTINILYNNKTYQFDIDSIWGFSKNNQIYINHGENNFFKVPLFGNLSIYLIQVKLKTYRNFNPLVNDQYFNNTYSYAGIKEGGTNTNKMVSAQMILDMHTGLIEEFTHEKLDTLLKRDIGIYNEYRSLSKKKRKSKAVFYIRKYNLNHPLYFPKN